jgi:HEAT repeat protein
MRTLPKLLSVGVILLALGCVAVVGGEGERPRPLYVSLLPEGSTTPAGHVVLRVPPDRKVPDKWDMAWFPSLITQHGYRLWIEELDDQGTPGAASTLVLKMPVGVHRLCISHGAGVRDGMGVVNTATGRWEAWDRAPLDDAAVDVEVRTGQVALVEVSYSDPMAATSEDDAKVRKICTWRDFTLRVGEGDDKLIPGHPPFTYALTSKVDLARLDEAALHDLLRDERTGSLAARALLSTSRVNVAPVIALLQHGSIPLDWEIAALLAKSKDPGLVSVCASILHGGQKDAPLTRRAAAAWLLGQVGLPQCFSALKSALAQDPLVRIYATLALGHIRHPETVGALATALKDDSSVRGTVFVIRDARSTMLLLGPGYKMVGEITPVPALNVRDCAIQALGEVQDPAAIELLLGLLDDTDASVRSSAALALGNYPDRRVVDALLARLKDRDGVRLLAAAALGRTAGGEALGSLDEMAKTDTQKACQDVARQAAAAIRKRLGTDAK